MLTIFETSGITHKRQSIWTCQSCEKPIGSKPYAVYKTAYGNRRVCLSCIKNYCEANNTDLEDVTELDLSGMHTCAICGAVYDTSDMTATTDGNYVCDDCLEDGSAFDSYEYCERCGDLTPIDEMRTVNVLVSRGQGTETWCYDCCEDHARACDDCGELWSDNYIDCYEVTGSTGNTETRDICSSCYEDDYYVCEGCGNLVSFTNAYVDECGDAYCPACCEHEGKLKPYGKTYATNFYKISQDPYAAIGLYLGVELETEATRDGCPEDLAADICDGIGEDRVECKHDGSLESGCEIVTQPMTPAYHLGDTGIWSDVVRICHGHGATSHDNGNCGMHIHVSRSALSSDGDFSPTWCLDRLMSTHRAAWVKFARRSCGMSWCSIDEQEPDTATPARDKYDDWREEYHGDRYRAVNLTNSATVEWRLCRGSLNLETIRASIEMIAGLVLVCDKYADAGTDPDGKSWGDLIADIVAELKSWDTPTGDLVSYLKRRDLMPETVTA